MYTSTETPSQHPTGYVCREHHHRPVNSKGKGCPDCASDRITARKKRRERRRAKAEGLLAVDGIV